MRVVPVPVLEDNYAYLLVDEASASAAAIDPAEPDKVLQAAEAEGVSIVMVLTTHKHWDHAGGNVALAARLPGVPVVGGESESVAGCSQAVSDGQGLRLGHAVHITCIHTPGHTMGHICYYARPAGPDGTTSSSPTAAAAAGAGVVFTGDTLFIGGAGKFFEGSPADMFGSLYHKLVGGLPPDTLVYCGHEYTLSNYKFALSLEPENAALVEENERALRLRQAGVPTVPSSLAKERATNPFLRVQELRARVAAMQQHQEEEVQLSPVEVLALVREMKNSFR